MGNNTVVIRQVEAGQSRSMSEPLTKKVLLIGWDAADWKVIHPLIAQGYMPTLKSVMDQGVWGNIATLSPILSPMLWTSIATGKRPYKHGIHGFIEPMPDGKGIRPSSSTTRKCKAVWNILTQKGMGTHQVGWFCSHPAEPINGVYVTNLYEKISSMDADEWKLADNSVHPSQLAETLGELRLHPTELVASQILPFLPKAAEIDQDKDRRLSIFAKLLCEMVNVHSAATWAMQHRAWNFVGVYQTAIDHFSHAFMQYHPPKMRRIDNQDFEIYKDVVVGCYRFHDMMLNTLLQLAGDDTTVIICSDHGFHSDHLRPTSTPHEPAGPAVWHREYGVMVMKGPGIKTGDRVYGATVLDITPTILALMGLPVANDMDGKPLVQAFDRSFIPPRIESWEQVEGEAGMHPPDKREDPFEARQAIEQLVELGYIDKPDENQQRAAADATREADYNLARAYLDGGQTAEAIELLEKLVKENPEQLRFALNLAQCYLAQRRRAEARSLIESILDRAQQQTGQVVKQLEARRQQFHKRAQESGDQPATDAGQPSSDGQVPADARQDSAAPDQASAPRITKEMLERADRRISALQKRLRSLDVRVAPRAQLLMGVLELHERHAEEAMSHLQEAEKAEPRLPGLHNQIGRVYLRMRRWRDALRAFRKALDIDGDSAMAHDGIAAAQLRLRRPTAAAEHALVAVGLLHHFPRAHLRLGIALAQMRMYERAVEAFETASKLSPQMAAPHRWLARIYGKRLNRPDLAAQHYSKAEFIKANR